MPVTAGEGRKEKAEWEKGERRREKERARRPGEERG
jgi:hypothetical protein